MKNAIFTKQDVTEKAIKTAAVILPFYMGFRKFKRDRDRQKERFEYWGERILNSKYRMSFGNLMILAWILSTRGDEK